MSEILIIEDDTEVGSLLAENLKAEGYNVKLAIDGKSGFILAKSGSADLIILDLMLPGMDGLRILSSIRRELIDTPVIILTVKDKEAERLDGFRAGCDDYISKPFSLMELIARVRAVLKRSGHKQKPSVINSGGVIIDPGNRSVSIDDRTIILPPKEFDLLYTLAENQNQALSRNHLLDEVWGEDADVNNRTVDTHISFLRRKLEKDPDNPTRIITMYKLGYMWKSSE